MEVKRVKMSEANQNFSKVAKAVEEDGIVIIEKNKEDRFAVLSMTEYRRLKGEVFWMVIDDNTFVKHECVGDVVTSYEVSHMSGHKYKYSQYRFPAGLMTVEHNGSDIVMNFNEALLGAISTRDTFTLFRSVEVDISDRSIGALAADKTKRDELRDAVTVKALIEEYDRAKIISPEDVHSQKTE